LAGPLHTPTGPMPGATPYGGSNATQRVAPDVTQRLAQTATPDATQRVGSGQADSTQTVYGRPPEAAQPGYGGGQWSVPGTGQPWTSPSTAPGGAAGPLGGVTGAGSRLVGTVKGWPRKVQLAAAGGLAVLLLIGAVALFGGGDEPTRPIVTTLPTATADAGPGVAMQEYSGRGVTVQVPKGWERKTGGVYVDYVDPADEGRKVRILAEKWGGTSMSWAEFASKNLKSKSKVCADPYNQLSMTEQELAGEPAAELEYTCGEGDAMRHGVWRGVAHDGKIYSFYLSATDAKFAESRAIFDAMVKSFQLTGAN
ncbi:PsbP-related protein, partial [Micromonospora globispora]|uniref:PsbP-related protein n=1 Tax=Micromonospora globispora TaxID=1450148 RepID=UPI000F944399